MRKELELDTLEERRTSLRLILMYKVVVGLVPELPPSSFVKNAKQKRYIKAKNIHRLSNSKYSKQTCVQQTSLNA